MHYLTEDLKAMAHFYWHTWTSHYLFPTFSLIIPSVTEATCPYKPSRLSTDRHVSHTDCTHHCVSMLLSDTIHTLQKYECPLLLLTWTLSEDSQIFLPCHVLPVSYAVRSLSLARTNSGKDYLFPAHTRYTFKYSSPFSSFNRFKTCYSTAFVLYFTTTSPTLFRILDPLEEKVFHSLNPHIAKIIHPLLTLTCTVHGFW